MTLGLNYKYLMALLCAAVLFGLLSISGLDQLSPISQAMAEEQYQEDCPPELCEQEEEAQEVDEDCPPEMCGEEEEEVVDEDCPPEMCGEGVEDDSSEASYEEEADEERIPVDRTLYSRLSGAMRNGMYQHVADDKEIDAVEQWISDGRKNDEFFINEIMPVMKENCSKCHSTSSTMSKAFNELPLSSYEEIVIFTKLAPPDSSCLDCHADVALEQHQDEALASIFVGKEVKEHSAHNEVPCIRCHYDLHQEKDEFCQDPAAFKGFIGSWTPGTAANCQETQKPECVKCHIEIGDKVAESIHFEKDDREIKLLDSEGNALKAPTCIDCHNTHDVVTSKQDKTSLNIVEGCGSCHTDLIDTYYSSYHGKAAQLGSEDTAKCFSCHGSHEMVSLKDEKSLVHKANIEKTCQECHDDTNDNFVGFIPHADHHDFDKHPILFLTFWSMTGLLFVVFAAFGIHTALWFNRSLIERKQRKLAGEVKADPTEKHVRRFNLSHTLLHLMVITSFLTLALTGMTIKFADNTMFQWIADVLGGPGNLALAHRAGAIVTGMYFALHLSQLLVMLIKKEITIMGLFKEDYTMIPLWRDALDVKANVLYFLGKGPKPSFGRWTYWEKFDYMAVFWGVAVIGISGLVLWFPAVATQFAPGWSINLAGIIHGEEALLATIFIFVVHFFHTHLRPEAAPLDPAIFTQRMPLSKFKEERPLEYKSLVEKGELEAKLLSAPSKLYMTLVYLFGFGFVAIGVFIVGAIFYSLLF